ncbi:MAG: endonuclease NucS [Desulfobacterales bacterium]|nr:endonuclease NucS [Desulfobacterales bacterium]
MGTEIKTWQIVDGKLLPVSTNLKNEGKTEPYDLEPWIASHPAIIGTDIAVIGRQVMSKSGSIDLLGIDKSGNLVIIEIKRDKLPREALAQAIDYASDAAEWAIEKIGEICTAYTGKGLVEFVSESFPEVDVEALNINVSQRIVLVGFSVESALERMIEWLSDNFNVNINAVVLNYVKTLSGDELLAKTSIISEELERERVKKKKKFEIPMSDEPGTYDIGGLEKLLKEYLVKEKVTSQRIRDVLLPALLKKKTLSREQLKKELLEYDKSLDASKIGYHLTTISAQLGMKKNDFLRQVVVYEYPTYAWEKDNFSLREDHRDLVKSVLEGLKK